MLTDLEEYSDESRPVAGTLPEEGGEEQEEEVKEENCFRILLATDIHLGYLEENPIRGNDSFIAFEEILYHAKEQKVDFILLGGDLFHHTTPSKDTYSRCLNLLNQFVLGHDPISFEMLSDHEVNFESPNINIAIPVFSIHGNHDDQSGIANKSSLEVLSESNLINYFGKWNDLMEVNVSPLLMKKGTTQLALYGLSHIRDNRLARLFKETKVTMEQPNEGSGNWFNMLVLHQNRIDRGRMNFIPEEILPDFLNFVLWGHEHDCQIHETMPAGKSFHISQPGSSVATSLSEGESIDKHIGLLYVCNEKFKLEPIKLQTVRPFVFKSIDLHDYEEELDLDEGDIVPKVKELVSNIIENMIKEAKKKESQSNSQPKLPLIRLRVVYRDESQVFNAIRFGQQYSNRVANPGEMLHMQRHIKRVKIEKKPIDEEAMENAFIARNGDEDNDDIRLEDYVNRYFTDPTNSEKLQVMPSMSLSDVCRSLAECNDENSAKRIVEITKDLACKFLTTKMPTEDEIEESLAEFRSNDDTVYKEINTILENRKQTETVPFTTNNRTAEKENQSSSASTSRGTRAAPAKSTTVSKPGRGRGAARANANTTVSTRVQSNESKTNGTQPTLQQTMSRRATRQRGVIYELDSD